MNIKGKNIDKPELASIPLTPHDVPQTEVTPDINTNGILKVSAPNKTAEKSTLTDITNDGGHLSKEGTERMVNETGKYKGVDDEAASAHIVTENGLKSYLYNQMSLRALDNEVHRRCRNMWLLTFTTNWNPGAC